MVNIYRIIQEIITNILKHAKATEVVFDVVETEDTLYIHIKDNGIGFDLNETQKGIGLKNIQKRYSYFTDLPISVNDSEGMFNVEIPLLKEV